MTSHATNSAATERTNPISNLQGWLHEPYIQEPVIAALRRAEMPLTLREISQAAGVRLRPANRVLFRLWKKGQVTRYKIPLQRHAFCRKRWECVPYAATRLLYVYSWVGERQ
jgi:hypothetical protein